MGIGSNSKGFVVNIYETSFYCKCPINKIRILYQLKIETKEIISVEELLNHIEKWYADGFHELIADHLAESFNGIQTLKADHHSVKITTIRQGNERTDRA
jgi:uncharacterized protein YktA (UPF0223 family)